MTTMEDIIECPYCEADIEHDPYSTVHMDFMQDFDGKTVTFERVLACEECFKPVTVYAHYDFKKLEVIF